MYVRCYYITAARAQNTCNARRDRYTPHRTCWNGDRAVSVVCFTNKPTRSGKKSPPQAFSKPFCEPLQLMIVISSAHLREIPLGSVGRRIDVAWSEFVVLEVCAVLLYQKQADAGARDGVYPRQRKNLLNHSAVRTPKTTRHRFFRQPQERTIHFTPTLHLASCKNGVKVCAIASRESSRVTL